ncbi:hypothetical protein FSP39_018485 [Pinctada imbricata]|uniref:ShKT domain-containing protein n=1 Tax=Pinctada imbricata TaxID=66713 RepID=A0AA89C808_PINIB|nr:hypothetical protein FSP39_018485 [Pinctada imbricata]
MSSDPTSKGLADGVSKVSIDGVRQEFLNFRLKRSPSIHPTTNDIQFKDPSVPFILHPDELAKDCNGVSCSNDTVCKCTQSISVGFMEPLILIFVVFGIDKEPHHPIHVHGHSFRILKVGYPEYDETSGHIITKNGDLNCGYSNQTYGCEWTNESWALGQIPGLELTNPPKKDTVVVPSGGYVIVHITADNPGTWIIHCHVESHVLNGMSIVLNEVPGQIPKPPKGFPSCGDFPPNQKYRTEPQINCSQTYENCTDNPKLDCRFFNYTQVCSQDSVYRPWARKNCPAYCGICYVPPTFTPCVDKLLNCEEYNKDLCTNPLYRFFREANCRKYCDLCT